MTSSDDLIRPDDLVRLSAADLSDRLGKQEVSAVEAAQAHLDRITATDETVGAFLHVDVEGALDAAQAIDDRRNNGEPLGRLAGVPLGLKDIFTTRGVPTTCGSRILEGWRPPYDATVTRRMRDAGLVILGKTNMDEFAMGSSPRARPTSRPATRGGCPASPADRRVAARPRSRRSRRRSASAPTPAARSGSPPPSAAWSGSSRPTGRSPGTA